MLEIPCSKIAWRYDETVNWIPHMSAVGFNGDIILISQRRILLLHNIHNQLEKESERLYRPHFTAVEYFPTHSLDFESKELAVPSQCCLDILQSQPN